MGFAATHIGQLGMVAGVMGCAVVGTVGILKPISCLTGGYCLPSSWR